MRSAPSRPNKGDGRRAVGRPVEVTGSPEGLRAPPAIRWACSRRAGMKKAPTRARALARLYSGRPSPTAELPAARVVYARRAKRSSRSWPREFGQRWMARPPTKSAAGRRPGPGAGGHRSPAGTRTCRRSRSPVRPHRSPGDRQNSTAETTVRPSPSHFPRSPFTAPCAGPMPGRGRCAKRSRFAKAIFHTAPRDNLAVLHRSSQGQNP